MSRGFTLIELILYVSVSAMLLLSASFFLFFSLSAQVENQVRMMVDIQGRQLIHQITQSIRNAQDINSPTLGDNANSLSLITTQTSHNPTVYWLGNSGVYLNLGVLPSQRLTSQNLEVTALNFQNLSKSNTPGLIRVVFTLRYKIQDQRRENSYAQTFYGSASLR